MFKLDVYIGNFLALKLILTNIVLIYESFPIMLLQFFVISAQRWYDLELYTLVCLLIYQRKFLSCNFDLCFYYVIIIDAASLGYDNIEVLTGSNFQSWKSHLEMSLGVKGLDYALREDKPTPPAEGVAG